MYYGALVYYLKVGIKYLGTPVVSSRSLFLALLFAGLYQQVYVWGDPIAVIYPEVRAPYQKVYENIAKGAEQELQQALPRFVLNDKNNDVNTWFEQEGISAAIALGNHSLKALGVDSQYPFVAGAIAQQNSASELYGVSLNPAPDLLFSGLKILAPDVSTIHVVYDVKMNSWEVQQARTFAEALGFIFQAYPVEDLRTAAVAYRDVQKKMQSGTDSLWLPLGGPARDKSIMQNILETAWVKDQVVFSSNLSDVKRGALFAMYPDNVGMGKELARLLQQIQKGEKPEPSIQFVRSLFSAVNRRTAEHLEFQISKSQLANYDFVYPPR